MGRITTRGFQRLWRALAVDDQERGPEVSEDIQLQYIVDDARDRTYIYLGSGGTEANVVGEHAIISLECRAPRGLFVDAISMVQPGVLADNVIFCWASSVLPTITTPSIISAALIGGGLDGTILPVSVTRTGTILTANIAVGAYRHAEVQPWPRFLLRPTFFFNAAFEDANSAAEMGIRWRELTLFPS